MAKIYPDQEKDTRIRLVKYGFMDADACKKYSWNEKKEHYTDEDGNINPEDADIEIAEEVTTSHGAVLSPTPYPKPYKRYRINYEAANSNIEEMYYWTLKQLQDDQGFPYVYKVCDIFAASENSAFFGNSQQRLGIQQDRVSNYLATIGKLIKDIFPLVRELRILDERLEIYDAWEKSKAADVTLKGLYIDLVEGGTKNPGSVLGMAGQVGFTSLPDLFFNTHVFKRDDVDKAVDAMKVNIQVKNVMKRKLFAYINWKDLTEKEMRARRIFTLRYLKQHWEVINMYMAWIRPNLKNVARLTMEGKFQDSADLISTFESAMTEVEIVLFKPEPSGACRTIVMTYEFRSIPSLNYQAEGYNRGPIHVGRSIMTFRGYSWNLQQVKNYIRYRRDEDIDLLTRIDSSVKAAMDAMGDELKKYLREAGDKFGEGTDVDTKTQASKSGSMNVFEPFIEVAKGFKEIGNAFNLGGGGKKKSEGKVKYHNADLDKVKGGLEFNMWQTYKNYKKSHGFLAW
ncbi:hypothetical protein JW868_04220 [Candidatus Woesearchaeota archaeon]|nr:hypothetical protein [Candidatus Woesearchaeota archaeon]